MADRGRRSAASLALAPKKGNARGIGSGRNSNARISELVPASPSPVNTKTTTTSFFRSSSCRCGHLRIPAYSLRPVISISHPKRPSRNFQQRLSLVCSTKCHFRTFANPFRAGTKPALTSDRNENQRRASMIRLKGVSTARRIVPRPADLSTSSSCRGPAWAPRTWVPFSEIAWAQHIVVDAE